MNIHCPHYKSCSGCSIDEEVNHPPILEQAEAFFQKKGINSFRLVTKDPTEWRTRAKLAIRGSWDRPQIGLYAEGTHDVIDIPFCKVHHPQINLAVSYLKRLIQDEKLEPYHEINHIGLLRYAQFIVEKSTGRVHLSLVVNTKSATLLEKILPKLWDMAGGRQFWHSFWVNCNQRKDNVIFSDHWQLMIGEPWLWEKFGSIDICFHPSSFVQANLDLFAIMVEKIVQIIPQSAFLTEFHAGVGVIGLCAASKCQQVHFCESSPLAHLAFAQSKSRLPKEVQEKLQFYSGIASEHLNLIEGSDVILVDPPRKGLDFLLLKALTLETHPKKLIYISCGWDTFQKDCEVLLKGGWKMESAEGYLFFPGTNHIETLVLFKNFC